MKKFLTNIHKEAQHIRMTSAEKTAMRASVFGVPTVAPVEKSPYFFAPFFSYNMRMSLAGLLLFVLAGAGSVSAAARGALPGDPLYPVKVLINERAELALAPDAAAKAVVQEELAGRRVEEAQTLAQQGRLDRKTADTLTADFDAHAAQALALAGPEDTQVGASADVSVQGTSVSPQAPEVHKKEAPVRSMMVRTMAVAASEEATTTQEEATSTPKEARMPFVQKHGEKRNELRAALEIKGELLKALKDRVSTDDSKNQNEEGQ